MLSAVLDTLDYLLQTAGYIGVAFGKFGSLEVILYVIAATLLGIVIGVLPGLTATMGLALLTTLTYKLEPNAALLTLMCLYVGAIYGGSRTAILLNIPGTPANAATTLDGFPLARSGRAGPAMGTATTGSFLGTLIGMLFLATIAPKLADYALKFQTHEFLWLAIFGILIAGQLTAIEDPLKGWIAGFLGLGVAMIGQEGLYMTDRFTFGYTEMQAGIGLIPAMVGAFGFSEVIAVMYNRRAEIVRASVRLLDVVPDPREIIRYRRTIARSGVIGTTIGIIPGVGEDIGAWVSYAAARRASKEKEKFGKGSVEGLMAAETGNNAACPGAVIPVLTLGIPGSAPAAVLLAAMVLHGVRPGPMIMIEFPSFVYEVVVMIFLAAVAMVVLGILLTPLLLKVLSIPRERLMPVIFVLCVIGSYAIQQRMFDVWVMVIFGIVGFVMREMKYPMAPLVLGIVLGEIFDKSFRRSWVIHDGDFAFYFSRPISVTLMLLCLLTVVMSITPFRRYIAPKIESAWKGTIGLFTGALRAHFALVAILAAATFGRGRERAPDAAAGRATPSARAAFAAYVGILADAGAGFLRGLAGLLIRPLLDILRLGERRTQAETPSADRGGSGPS
jgi:putative tricarboxylic transport membrane protein